MSLPRKLAQRDIRLCPRRSLIEWAIRTVTETQAGSAITQAKGQAAYLPVAAVQLNVSERDVQYLGMGLRAGDLRLVIATAQPVDEETVLCYRLKDEDEWIEADVRKVFAKPNRGGIQQYSVYVHRRKEDKLPGGEA